MFSFVLLSVLLRAAYTIDCNVIYGDWSGPNEGDLSQTSCSTGYILVSCGFQTLNDTAWLSFDGSYIENDICYARMGFKGNPWFTYLNIAVQAIARCCALPSSTTCTTYQSPRSNIYDDNKTVITCPETNQILMGCGVSTDGGYYNNGDDYGSPAIDGSYPLLQDWWDPTVGQLFPTNNSCTAANGGEGTGVYAWATCCSTTDPTVDIKCGMIKGNHSPKIPGQSNNGQLSIVTCPSDYFMTGCSSFTYFKSHSKWAINDDNECVARAVDRWNDSDYGTTASAIWYGLIFYLKFYNVSFFMYNT